MEHVFETGVEASCGNEVIADKEDTSAVATTNRRGSRTRSSETLVIGKYTSVSSIEDKTHGAMSLFLASGAVRGVMTTADSHRWAGVDGARVTSTVE